MSYSVVELRELWLEYHLLVHDPLSGVPCDANPGDACYAVAFLDWLDVKHKRESRLKRIAGWPEKEQAKR